MGAVGDGRVVRMELDKLTTADVEEVTGQSHDDDDGGLPNISSISIDQSPESFDASESWRDDVLPNELE